MHRDCYYRLGSDVFLIRHKDAETWRKGRKESCGYLREEHSSQRGQHVKRP